MYNHHILYYRYSTVSTLTSQHICSNQHTSDLQLAPLYLWFSVITKFFCLADFPSSFPLNIILIKIIYAYISSCLLVSLMLIFFTLCHSQFVLLVPHFHRIGHSPVITAPQAQKKWAITVRSTLKYPNQPQLCHSYEWKWNVQLRNETSRQ